MNDDPRTNAREWDEDTEADDLEESFQLQENLLPAAQNAPAYAATRAKHKHGLRKESADQHFARSRAYRDEQQTSPLARWQPMTSSEKRVISLAEQPAVLIDLDEGSTNDAETSWRRHELPVDEIMAPHELACQSQYIESIARNCHTFILAKPSKDGNEVHCGIWGEKAAVKRAKQAVVDWIKREMPSKGMLGTSYMPKVVSLLPKQLVQEERRWKRAVKRQKYRQFPPLGTVFGAIGTFHWPTQEYRPDDVLGRSYEALDPIRMDHACYIVFEKDISSFHLMGDNADVKQALLRMRKVCFQVAARQLPTIRGYHLQSAEEEIPSHVRLTPYERTKKLNADYCESAEVGQCPLGEGILDDEIAKNALVARTSSSLTRAKRMLVSTLQRLHYYRGHLELRVRLGTFIARQYRLPQDGVYTIKDFGGMLQQSQFVGHVTAELGNLRCETGALRALQAADHLLTPQIGTIEELSSIKPVYTVVFNFEDRNGDIRLIIAWHEEDLDSSGRATAINEVSRKWLRLERGAEAASPLVDVSLCNLKNSSAWQFDLVATQAVDVSRLPPELLRLAKTINIDAAAMSRQRPDVSWVKYVAYAPVKLLQQRASYRYGLGRTDYTVELTRFQDRVFTAGMLINHAPSIATYQPRWSLEVFHNSWDTMFTANERVAIGERADWDDDLSTWFPAGASEDGSKDGGIGFEQLVAQLYELEAVVVTSKVESYGGMEIG